MRTPSPSSVRSSRRMTLSLASNSSNSWRMRSRLSAVRTSSSRLARPDTISVPGSRSPAPAQTATPASTICSVISSICRRAVWRRRTSSDLASPMVRPAMRALRKLAASTRVDAVAPGGSEMIRFSTIPFSPTMITSARFGSSRTNSICLRRRSALVAITSAALRASPDSRLPASPSRLSSVRSRAAACTLASMASCSSAASELNSRKLSTKKRSPASVGSRPALVCGA